MIYLERWDVALNLYFVLHYLSVSRQLPPLPKPPAATHLMPAANVACSRTDFHCLHTSDIGMIVMVFRKVVATHYVS